MSRRPGTASATAAPPSKPQSLNAFIQAAIDAEAPADPSVPKKSRRRRKKRQEMTKLEPASVQVKPEVPAPPPPVQAKPKRSKRKSKLKNAVLRSREVYLRCTFRVRGLVTAEELEDEDEAEEVQREVRADFRRFGELHAFDIVREENEKELVGDVVLVFQDAGAAASAFTAFNGNVFGGKTVACIWEDTVGEEVARTKVEVRGMVMPEELEDPDEAAEVNEEMMQIFGRHGEVAELRLSEVTGDATVSFCNESAGRKAVQAINGSRYGGRLLTAVLLKESGDGFYSVEHEKATPEQETKPTLAPIVQPSESIELQNLVEQFLKRLADLQERAHTQNPLQDKRSRRLVLGLHEVRRGLLNNKVRLLLIATNPEACRAVEEKIAELVTLATEQEVPVLSPMNRRKLGRVLRKSIRVTCVGVYSVEGANEHFQQILQCMQHRVRSN